MLRTILSALMQGALVLILALPAGWADEIDDPEQEDEQTEIEARKYTSARDKRDIVGIELTPYLSMGFQAEAEAQYERQAGTSDLDAGLEELSIGFEGVAGDYLSGFILFTGEFVRDTQYFVDEAYLRLGGTDVVPWFLQGGHMEMPFGEFESHFVEDPLVQVIGETEGDGVTAGYESEMLEISVTLFQGNDLDNNNDNLIVIAKIDPVEGFECGVSWINDIAESVELIELQRELRRERTEDAEELDVDDDAEEDEEDEEEDADGTETTVVSTSSGDPADVPGVGIFAILEYEPFFVDLEYIAAIESFAAGRLADRPQRPWAWHLEIGVRPISRWEIAARVEQADELPEYPDVQYGVATSFGITQRLSITVDYLRGEFDGPEPRLDLAGASLTYEL